MVKELTDLPNKIKNAMQSGTFGYEQFRADYNDTSLVKSLVERVCSYLKNPIGGKHFGMFKYSNGIRVANAKQILDFFEKATEVSVILSPCAISPKRQIIAYEEDEEPRNEISTSTSINSRYSYKPLTNIEILLTGYLK
jgi:hypothetical protein